MRAPNELEGVLSFAPDNGLALVDNEGVSWRLLFNAQAVKFVGSRVALEVAEASRGRLKIKSIRYDRSGSTAC